MLCFGFSYAANSPKLLPWLLISAWIKLRAQLNYAFLTSQNIPYSKLLALSFWVKTVGMHLQYKDAVDIFIMGRHQLIRTNSVRWWQLTTADCAPWDILNCWRHVEPDFPPKKKKKRKFQLQKYFHLKKVENILFLNKCVVQAVCKQMLANMNEVLAHTGYPIFRYSLLKLGKCWTNSLKVSYNINLNYLKQYWVCS